MNEQYYLGKRVVISDCITKKVQRRTNRKRRINKKWAKRYGYKDVPDDSKVMVIGDMIFMTQKAYDRLKDYDYLEEIIRKI